MSERDERRQAPAPRAQRAGTPTEEALRHIDDLVAGLNHIADPAGREAARALVETVLDLHGLALARIMAIVAESDRTLLDRLAADEQIRAVLLLYGLVVGAAPFRFVAEHYKKPLVISGFEPLDILQSIWMVLKQLDEGRCRIENQYARIVPEGGNRPALRAVSQVYELRAFFEWRGLGSIDHSGVRIRERYSVFDAERKFALANTRIADPKSCQCGEVLKGVIKPWQCKVFGTACTPERPLGALMVSSEGACAAYYQYGGIRQGAA